MGDKTTKRIWRALAWLGLFLTIVLLPVFATRGYAGPTVVKVAVVTPEGSAWVKVLKEMVTDVRTQTQGAVEFVIYAGGVSGDEADVLRKMRANRLQAAGLSGVGLGVVLPEIRVLEAPLLFRTDAEIDMVREGMFDYFAAALEKKGYVLLGFAEGGWVYLFSKNDLSSPPNLQNAKMWVWEGDRVAETFLSAFDVRTTPLHIADVNTGLETGMIDAFYAPPLAAMAFQWSTRVAYMLDYPLVNSTGALIMTKRSFQQLPVPYQETIKKLSRHYCNKLVQLTREDNAAAKALLEEQQLEFVIPSEKQRAKFHKDAQTTYARSIPDLYSRSLFDRIQQMLKKHRGGE